MKRGSVLVVDGNPTTRKQFKLALEEANYEVVEADTGRAALNALAVGRVGVVLLELRLPDGAGADLARRILTEAPALPIVALAGWAHLDDKPIVGAGFVEVLFKPVPLPRLLEVVERHLGHPSQAALPLGGHAALTASFARRACLEATAASLFGSIEDAFSRRLDPESTLDETLSRLLGAAAPSVGALLLFGEGHRLVVRAEVGGVPARVWGAYGALFDKALEAGGLAIPSHEAGEQGRELLLRAGISAAEVVPIVARGEAFGVLVLGPSTLQNVEINNEFLFWAARSVAGQVGQALSLLLTMQRDVAERLELAERLRHTHKLDAVGRLAGGFAHDMNDILGAIFSYAEFLESSMSSNDARREDAAEIRRAAERGAALTRQLLAFSRQQGVHPKQLDPNDVVRNTSRIVRTLVGEDVRVVTSLTEDLPNVMADPGMLEQVIVNLAFNSRDAMPAGGELRIATEVRGDRVVLCISDTGSGMASHTLDHVFEPFFTTKPAGKGTGLGLATVFGIVEQSGGKVEVESALEKGTTFRISLPAVSRSPVERTAARADQVRSSGGGETVVVVEDEAPLRNAFVRALRERGYRVISEPTEQSTLDACRAYGGEIHLLVTDVVLPALDGPEIARRLLTRHPGLRVLFVSGYTDTTVYPDVPVGERGFLQKPFTPRVLAARVREVLDAAD